jgi:hypothetical protein
LLRPFVVISFMSAATGALADPVPLAGDELKTTVSGSIVEIDTPLGTTVPMRFGTDGLVSAEAGALAPVLGAAKDRGRWWVDGDKLCTKWFRWFDARVRCLTIARDGSRIAWRKIDDGETGTATLIQADAPAGKSPSKPERTVVANAPTPPVTRKKVEAAPAPAAQPAPIEQADGPPVPLDTGAPTVVADNAPATDAPGGERMRFGSMGLLNASRPTGASAAEPHKTAGETPDMALADLSPVRRPSASAKRALPKQTPQQRPAAIAREAEASKPKGRKQQIGLATSSIRSVALYRVQGVRGDDVLNVRRGPSETHVSVAAIPATGRQVEITGRCLVDWCPIRYGGVRGWVNRYYLVEDGWRDEASAASVARQ